MRLTKLLPRTLLTRMLLIIIVPTMLAQAISTYIFYSKHWDNMRRYIIYTLSNEIALIVNTYQNLPKKDVPAINKYTFLRYKFVPMTQFTPDQATSPLPSEIKILSRNLDYDLPTHPTDITFNKRTKEVEIKVGKVAGGMLLFHINHKKVFVKSTYTFIMWMVGSSLALLLITLIFAKNQIRSISRLSTVADKLAKGQPVQRFIPNGAAEVRNVGYAFLKMKETIEDEVKRKSQMLAWVSHDLRTPLTRMKLRLALTNERYCEERSDVATSETQLLKADIRDMERIINDYLDFAKGEAKIKPKRINLTEVLRNVIKASTVGATTSFELKSSAEIYAQANEHQLKRALSNLLDNAKRFASEVTVVVSKQTKNILIEIHDNGPGIAEQELKDVLKPFYRGTRYNDRHSSGSGLGLPIAENIIKNHLGSLSLGRSQVGGLLVSISIPNSAS